MKTTYQTLSVTTLEDAITLLSLDRPNAANALNTLMAQELRDFFISYDHSITVRRAIILTGEGRHFCAGADLKERKGMDEAQWYTQHRAFEGALGALMECTVPVLAAVNGAAMGGGLELALACDFIYAAENARFALTETTLGIMPGLGGTQTLPRAIGMSRAKELIFTGYPFSAQEAYDWGMVNRLCPAESLRDDTLACARQIAANAPLAVQAAKRAMDEGDGLPLADGLRRALAQYETLLGTKDRHEGINAFNDKRKPAFSGA